MRLHRLEMSAFLAFGGTEAVDFDALSEAGLFLLQGPTGAGKSSILDAICFALYGHVSDERPGGEDLRSHHADARLRTSVTLELTLRGRRLRITRTPKQERPKIRGEGMTTDPPSLSIVEITPAGEKPLSSGPQEASVELSELIGMRREEFRQVVMLPQGGFAKVLHAGSGEREELLRGLFDVSRFSAVERWLKDRAAAARADREEAEELIARALMLACHTSGEEPDDDQDAGTWIAGQAARAAAARDAAAGSRTGVAAALESATSTLEAERERLRLAEAAASAAAVARDALRETGHEGEAPEPDRLRADAARLRELAGATRALAAQEQELISARDRVAKLTASEAEHEQLAATADAGRELELASRPEREAALEAARTAAIQVPALADAHQDARARLVAAAERDSLRLSIAGLEDELSGLRDTASSAREHHLDLRKAQLDSYAAHLAEQLEDGAPCVVCGATEHPEPHHPGDAPSPSELEVEQAAAAEERAVSVRDAAAETLNELRSALAGHAAIAGDDTVEALTLAAAEARSAHDVAVEAAATSRALEEQLLGLEGRLEELRLTAQSARERVVECRSERLSVERSIDALEQQLAEARGDRGTVAERAEELAEQASRVECAAEAVEAARAAAEKVTGDSSAAAGIEELERAQKAAAEESASVERAFAVSSERADTLAELVVAHAEAVEAARPLIERHELLRSLHDFADGTAASNEKRMRLTVFVLAAKLEQVTAAATSRLEQMSRGRYSLVHSDEHRGRKHRGGLDLRVLDAHTGRERAPSSLSGGETFYASLALALGLADVITAESGGVRLDTLFIDEGFGTLDDEGTLDDVLDVLDGLRAGGRAVGVVSHVRELRDRITAQLRVQPGTTGSRIIQEARPEPAIPSLREELERALPEPEPDSEPAASLFPI